MKRLVIFCDGTWNRMSAAQPTNVLTGAQLVLPADSAGAAQITYYDEGVGTTGSRLASMLAGAFGFGLLDKIEAAYRFLIFNYEPGDEIFIFGFSRGAYTARSLAGLIRKCGIVPRSRAGKIREIFDFYKDAGTHPDSDEAQRRRMELCPEIILKDDDRQWRLEHGADPREVENAVPLILRYVGVWDTVGALGVPKHLLLSGLTAKKYEFHDTELSSTVKSARHAVAIDEDRLAFTPALWSNLDTLNAATTGGNRYRQLWFPGDHGSVGGGGDIRGLSDAALAWIMEGAVREGLAVNVNALGKMAAGADPTAPLSNQTKPPGWLDRLIYRGGPRTGPQQAAELSDSARARLAYEGKGDGFAPYRPMTLKALWPQRD